MYLTIYEIVVLNIFVLIYRQDFKNRKIKVNIENGIDNHS